MAVSNQQVAEVKEGLFRMATSAFQASKVGWTRARQYTEEKIGNAEKTEFDAQFENLCYRADCTKDWTEKILHQAEAMVQPNPAFRMEQFSYELLNKPHPIRPPNSFELGQVMEDASHSFGPGTAYGESLKKVGGTMKLVGNRERDFAQQSMSHFLHPLRSFLDNEMKTITRERRSLAAKRLDLDAAKNRVKKSPSVEKMRQAEQELRTAQAEFDRQFEVTKLLLDGVASSHANHMRSLASFVEAMNAYYSKCQVHCTELMASLPGQMTSHMTGAAVNSSLLSTQSTASASPAPARPPPFNPNKSADNSSDDTKAAAMASGNDRDAAKGNSATSSSGPSIKRKATVLYDYDAVDQTELSLLADETIIVYSVEGLDIDWMMAERGNQRGKVPMTYIELN